MGETLQPRGEYREIIPQDTSLILRYSSQVIRLALMANITQFSSRNATNRK
ncbi:MAG: hypothetical protein ACTSXF_02230 [Promethearchaeota archaeon]